MIALDYEFDSIIASASLSRTLQLCREPIGQLFYPACLRLVLRLNVVERMVFAHEQILDGLRNRDIGKARLWMTKHIVDSKRGYELANMAQPIPWPADE